MHVVSSNSFMHFELGVQTERGGRLFSDVRVRQALFHAIDRQAIADQLLQGTVTVAHSPINPSSPYFNPELPRSVYDPELSKRMLDEAGWRPGPDGVRVRGGERLSFTMMLRAGTADRIAVAQVIQAQLKDIGVEVTFETLENAAWTQRWRRGQWEGIVNAWFLPADPSITVLYACDGANNMTGLCSPELDSVMKDSDRRLDLASRKPLLDEAQVLLAQSAHALPIYYNPFPLLVSERVGNFRPSGTNFGSFWNLWEWTLP